MKESLYEKRKANGICVRCGKNKAREKRVLCEECKKKQLIYDKETRKFRIKMGFCPSCGRNRLLKGAKRCAECIATGYAATLKHREKLKLATSKRQKNQE